MYLRLHAMRKLRYFFFHTKCDCHIYPYGFCITKVNCVKSQKAAVPGEAVMFTEYSYA